jgi:hypothetical protein
MTHNAKNQKANEMEQLVEEMYDVVHEGTFDMFWVAGAGALAIALVHLVLIPLTQ